MTSDPVLTPDEVAAECRVTPYTVRGWLKANPQQLRGVKRGNRWFIRRSVLDEYLGLGADHRATA